MSYNASAWLVDRHLEEGRSENIAIVCEDQRLTYADVYRSVCAAANGFVTLGLDTAARIVLVVNDEPAFVAAFLGAMRLGLVPVPVSTMLTPGELAVIAADAEASALVVSEAYAASIPTVRAGAPSITATFVIGKATTDEVRSWSEFDDAREVSPVPLDDRASGFWLYTSGTTGKPKGAMHSHHDLEATARTYARSVLGIDIGDRAYSVAKLFFAYGLGNSLTFPFSVGATAVLDPARPTPAGVAALVDREQATLFFASPGFCAALLDAGIEPARLSSVRLGVTAGEALPADLHRRFTEHFGFPVLDGIGSTEALHIFLSNRVGAERAGTSGMIVDGYDAKLLDEHDVEVTTPDTPGFLHVKGESVASGYYRRPDATAQSFRGDWLRTGDVYARSDDGYWTFLGRNNDMIKAGGIWVSPAEVENVLVEHDDVLEAAVVGARDDNGLETVVAFLVPRSGRTIDVPAIEAHCRARMAAFKRPRTVLVVDALPKTATGKVQRYALRQRLAGTPG
jgi:benzoate-CoA ligase family protein